MFLYFDISIFLYFYISVFLYFYISIFLYLPCKQMVLSTRVRRTENKHETAQSGVCRRKATWLEASIMNLCANSVKGHDAYNYNNAFISMKPHTNSAFPSFCYATRTLCNNSRGEPQKCRLLQNKDSPRSRRHFNIHTNYCRADKLPFSFGEKTQISHPPPHPHIKYIWLTAIIMVHLIWT